ncbi:hypothetical protein K432DRAFT_457528 [Lepidopterella palustris CBS 459.81]|uniref:Homologous-pairing protein 2 winged helix domain-containing protein n=1 Tax=Lepidopterella palustris CBS 459.81 TaxID=1314670 RepID=A0A8E2E713_9PEZI|nr:hypothetical protein K432DRAFT_457528 [Lepidopterella palustris CBS 459.81]
MAPRKEKTEKVSADEAADTILNYLRRQPTSLPTCITKLQKACLCHCPKPTLYRELTSYTVSAAAAKILKDLHERKEIEGRAAGRSPSFSMASYRPNIDNTCAPERLASLDTEIGTLRDATTATLNTAKVLRASLVSLNSTLSTAQLRSTITAQEEEKISILSRLDALREGTVRPVSGAEKEIAEKELRAWKGVCVARQKISVDMWTLIEESLPEGVEKGELRERLGLDE